MNIRRPLIKEFGILDQNYEEDMVNLEEKDKSLQENFSIKGYSFNISNYWAKFGSLKWDDED